jgi:hypothetical protein
MARWYAGFLCYGRPQLILDQIANKIRADDLGRFVPRISFEKRPRHEFYLFVAIESEKPGEPPEALREFLSLPPLRNPLHPQGRNHGYAPFTREDIKRLVGADANVQDYARRISYRRLTIEPVGDPFGQVGPDAWTPIDDEMILVQTGRLDRLLLWMSAAGSGSLETFRAACLALGLAVHRAEVRRLVRRLRLLGHIECSRDGSRWSIAPTVLTHSGTSNGGYHVLCGGRDQVLTDQLRRASTLEEVPQPGGLGPALVRVHDISQSSLAALPASHMHLVDSSAEQLATSLPPITEWPETLQTVHGIIPARFDIKRFDGTKFADVPFANESGLYEFWPIEGTKPQGTAPQFVAFYDAVGGRWFRGDWYGLRFLSCIVDGESPTVRYDAPAARLAVPEERRWPEIYERAAVLASGQLPTRRQGWLVYEAIEPRLTEVLATNLSLFVEEGATGA